MRFRALLIPCAMLLAGAVAAQSAAPTQTRQDDRWEAAPAATSSSHFRADRVLPGRVDDEGVFHFKQTNNKHGPAYQPPPRANDKAAVMGKPRPWQNGRPPVDCAIQPRDPACH